MQLKRKKTAIQPFMLVLYSVHFIVIMNRTNPDSEQSKGLRPKAVRFGSVRCLVYSCKRG